MAQAKSTQNQTSIREQLLNKTSEPRRKKVDVEGIEVELYQPTLSESNRVMEESREATENETSDFRPLDYILRCVIHFTYEPGTSNRVFQDNDYDYIKSRVATWMNDLIGEMATLVNVSAEEQEKN